MQKEREEMIERFYLSTSSYMHSISIHTVYVVEVKWLSICLSQMLQLQLLFLKKTSITAATWVSDAQKNVGPNMNQQSLPSGGKNLWSFLQVISVTMLSMRDPQGSPAIRLQVVDSGLAHRLKQERVQQLLRQIRIE
jgi:hypothetical protein